MGLYERDYYQDDEPIRWNRGWDQRSAVSVLILINVAIFVANAILGNPGPKSPGAINDLLLLRSSDASQPWYWWHTLSYAFAHNARDIFHIFFNMLSLYFLGQAVEQRYGRREFYRIYLLAAWLGGVFWLVLHAIQGGAATVQGASGAVLCVTMLFVLNYPKATVLLFIFPVPAWVLGVLIVLTNFFAANGAGIAYDVHAFGIVFALLYFYLGWNFSWISSPADWLPGIRRWMTRPRLRVHRDRDAEKSDREALKADRILAKIHESGKDSLTADEKRFMERYSRTMRDKKRSES